MNAPEVTALAQAAAVDRWLNDAALLAHLGGPHVFEDRVPEGLYPTRYIVLGDQTAIPVGVMGTRATSATMAASAWTRDEPDKGAVVETVRLMDAALADSLSLTGFTSARLKNISTAVVPNDDPALHHAPVRYRINAFAE